MRATRGLVALVVAVILGAVLAATAVAPPALPPPPPPLGAPAEACTAWNARIAGLTTRIVALRTRQLEAAAAGRAAIDRLAARKVISRRGYQALWRAGCESPRPPGGPFPGASFDSVPSTSCGRLVAGVPGCVLALAHAAADGYGVPRPRVRRFVQTTAHASGLVGPATPKAAADAPVYVLYMAGDFLDPLSGEAIDAIRIDIRRATGAAERVGLRAKAPKGLGAWRAF